MKKTYSKVLIGSILAASFNSNSIIVNAATLTKQIETQPTIQANALTKVDKDSEIELSQVVLYQDSSKTIVTLVNKKQVEAYKKEISTNPDFKQQEINNVINANNAKANNRLQAASLPPGRIIAQRCMYRNDIQSTVDRLAGYGTFARILSNPISDATVGALVKAAGFSNPATLAATALTWAGADLLNRETSWWNESLLMILKGQISCVRVTNIENTVSEYPKAYLIIERI
jgi:hypothetical protein